METVGDRRTTSGELATLATRVVVQLSNLAGVAAGCWLVGQATPQMGALAVALYIATFLLARWRVAVASALVLFFAYTNVGLGLLAAPALSPGTLWVAALAGLVGGGCSWTRWHAPDAWRWPLMLWLVGVAVSWPIIAAREADFAVLSRGDGVGLVVLNALVTLNTGLWLDGALTWRLETIERRVAWPLLVSVALSAAAVFYQSLVDMTLLSSEIWIQLRRAPGLMGDANPMAVAAAVWAPLAWVLLRRHGGVVVATIVTVLLWCAAWLTGARSVILLIAAGAIGLISGEIAARTTARRAAWLAAAGAVAAVLVVIVLSRTAIGGPVARLASTLPLDRPMDLAYEVLWRRDGYGLAAARAIREHPWSGVGHGAFYVLSSYFHRLETGTSIPPDNAQNLWRQMLAERGVLAFAAVLALTIATGRLLVARGEAAPLPYTWTLRAIVIGLALVLVFGYPIQDPAIAFTAALLVAWLHAAVAPRSGAPTRHARRWLTLVWLLALGGAVLDMRSARSDLRPPWRAARVGDLYLYGFGDIETGPRGVTGRSVEDYAVVALRPASSRYTLQCWVRGSEARHVRAWLNRRLVMDELLPPGVLVERVLDSRMDQGMMLEFATDPPGMVVGGKFNQ